MEPTSQAPGLLARIVARIGLTPSTPSIDPDSILSTCGDRLYLGKVNKQRLSLAKPGSVLVIGSPGSGKTSGIVIPSILESDSQSMLINDPNNGELWEKTAGYRSTLGPCFRMGWSERDSAGIVNPCFNALDLVPAPGINRDYYLSLIANTLLPESKNSDTHFVNRGRAAMTGFLHGYLEDKDFHRDEPSMPGLVRWLLQMYSRAVSGHPDPMQQALQSLLDEKGDAWPARFRQEIISLINANDKERSGILGTMEQALLVFKSEVTIQRTGSSDFLPHVLRGMLTQESWESMGLNHYPRSREDWDVVVSQPDKQHWQPVSIYLCGLIALKSDYRTLDALFLECCVYTLMDNLPGSRTPDGNLVGPFETSIILDQFFWLQPTPGIVVGMDISKPSVVEGRDLSEGIKISWLLTAQDSNQLYKNHSFVEKNVLDSNPKVKILQNQGNPTEIQSFIDKIGKKKVGSHRPGCNPNSEHLVMETEKPQQAFWAKTVQYFEDSRMTKKVSIHVPDRMPQISESSTEEK